MVQISSHQPDEQHRVPRWEFLQQSLGIWKFSKQQQEAKKFIRYLFERENFNQWMEAAAGYNMGLQRDFATHPVLSRDPKIAVSPKNIDFGRSYGWPAKPGDWRNRRDLCVTRHGRQGHERQLHR